MNEGEGPFWVVFNILKAIETMQECEDRCIDQFGASSSIATQAHVATHESRGLLLKLVERFTNGLLLSPGESSFGSKTRSLDTDICAYGEVSTKPW